MNIRPSGSPSRRVAESALQLDDDTSTLNDVATYLEASGSVTAAIGVAERALALAQDHFDGDHPDTLGNRNNLVGAYESGGNEERLSLPWRTLSRQRRER